MSKTYGELEWPNEGMFSMYDEPESPNEGACSRCLMYRGHRIRERRD